MKQPILLAFFVLLYASTGNAQYWRWATQISNAPHAAASSVQMTHDKYGNLYLLAHVGDDTKLGGIPVASEGYSSTLLASYNCQGDLRWYKMFSCKMGHVANIALKADTLGGVYLAMRLEPMGKEIHLDKDTIIKTNQRIGLIKYDITGKYQWSRFIDPVLDTFLYRGRILDMDISGNGTTSVLCRLPSATYASGAYTVTDTPVSTHMLLYDNSGNFINGFPVNIVEDKDHLELSMIRMAWDAVRNKYYFSSHVNNWPPVYEGTVLANGPILAKFDHTGHMEWLKQGDPGSLLGATIAGPVLDQDGNIYLSTGGQDGLSFNGHTFTNTLKAGVLSAAVFKLDSGGKNIWVTNSANIYAEGSGVRIGLTAMTLSKGILAGTGICTGALKWGSFKTGADTMPASFLDYQWQQYQVQLDTATGDVRKLDVISTDKAYNDAQSMSADPEGNLYTGGQFHHRRGTDRDVTFDIPGVGRLTQRNISYFDYFILKYGNVSCPPTAVPGAAAATVINAYPNPADQQLNIDFGVETRADISMTDISGRTLIGSPVKGRKISLDTRGLFPGFYIVRINYTDGRQDHIKVTINHH